METNQNTSSTPPTSQGSSNNTLMGILAYLGILVIIPLLVSKDNQFVKFHSKQGLVLAIIWFIGTLLWRVSFFYFVMPIINLGCLILAIIGIINVVGGQMKELPLVGHLAKNFKF